MGPKHWCHLWLSLQPKCTFLWVKEPVTSTLSRVNACGQSMCVVPAHHITCIHTTISLFSFIIILLASIAFSASAAVFRVANPNPGDGIITYMDCFTALEGHLHSVNGASKGQAAQKHFFSVARVIIIVYFYTIVFWKCSWLSLPNGGTT